ncbi:PH domain-containing protein [Niabella sp. CC-SYL272]|uniref:PH domain-containing protein n=1 Tax=Niabella agricola TaxID=2891571 RepID=UPI001F41EDA5|nr:PH domain-containing protein [Niabella agricola]MCF3110831.1 PH domain-containing protein [Niabella agricola]
MKFELQPNEAPIDTWAINYIGPNNKAAVGKLTITNQRLLFLPQHDMDSLSLSIYNRKGMIVLNKSDIKDVTVQKSLLSKKVFITMPDDSVHIFNYGMMNIDKLVAAIQTKEIHNQSLS